MIEKITELKNKATERANYYTKIDFPNLANEFTELVNILNEMENIINENEKLKEQVRLLEEKTKVQETFLSTTPIDSETAIKIGTIMQTRGEERNAV